MDFLKAASPTLPFNIRERQNAMKYEYQRFHVHVEDTPYVYTADFDEVVPAFAQAQDHASKIFDRTGNVDGFIYDRTFERVIAYVGHLHNSGIDFDFEPDRHLDIKSPSLLSYLKDDGGDQLLFNSRAS